MSTRAVGDLVYPSGNPRKIGIVKRCFTRPSRWPGHPFELCEVRWLDGSTSSDVEHMLPRIDDLIADHERKLIGHLKRRDEAAALLGARPRNM